MWAIPVIILFLLTWAFVYGANKTVIATGPNTNVIDDCFEEWD